MACSCPPAPASHAPPSPAAPRLAQPAVAGRRLDRRPRRARARGARRLAHRPRIAHRVEQLRRRAEQLAPGRQARDEVGPVLQPRAVDDRVGSQRPRRGRRARSAFAAVAPRRDRPQVGVAEAVHGHDVVAVGGRQLRQHPRADGDDEDPHRSTPESWATSSVAHTRSAVVPGFRRLSGERSDASKSAIERVPARTSRAAADTASRRRRARLARDQRVRHLAQQGHVHRRRSPRACARRRRARRAAAAAPVPKTIS